jgi:hypothetical protein
MPVNSLTALPRGAEMEQRVCELAAAGHYDDEIARILTAEGHRSPWRGAEVLPSTVRGIRLRHGRKTVRQRTRWPAVLLDGHATRRAAPDSSKVDPHAVEAWGTSDDH